MKLNGSFLTSATSLPLWLGIRGWMSTLDYRVAYGDPAADPVLHPGPPKMFSVLAREHPHATAHAGPLPLFDAAQPASGRRPPSAHCQSVGFDCVRGSTARGGARALRELVTRGRTQHLTMTPDGPRGPRRVCSPGPIFLASKLGMPIVLLGLAYQRPWRVSSWDKFAVPKPFSRARAIMSEQIVVPPKLGKEALEQWRQRIEQQLNQLTDEAQAWANSGACRAGERSLRREGAAPPIPVERERRQAA